MTIEENALNLATHLMEILGEEKETCDNIGIDLKGKSTKEKWKALLMAQGVVYGCGIQKDIDVVEYVGILNRLAMEIMMGDILEEFTKYRETGLTAEEMELILNPPEKIYCINYIRDYDKIEELILDNEKITLMGEKSHWNCHDKDGYEYTISVSGLNKEYFLSKEMAEKNTKQPR